MIRPIKSEDIPQLVVLLIKNFPFLANKDEKSVSVDLEEVLFFNPWKNTEMPSLVYEESNGKIKGFIGISPRTMNFRGETITVAITHNLFIEPGKYSGLVAAKFFKSVIHGPQDLVVSGSAGNNSKMMWKRNGGYIAHLYSIGWRIPLRPARCVLNYIKKKDKLTYLSKLLNPVASGFDYLLQPVIKKSRTENNIADVYLKEMNPTKVVQYQKEFSARCSLQPDYTPEKLKWVMGIASKASHLGTLTCRGVFDINGMFLGWFTMYINPHGKSEVIQMHAKEGYENTILSNLIRFAEDFGSVELIGRLNPDFMSVLSGKYSFFRPGRMWMLYHSKNPDIVSAVARGDVFLSRFEDDLWLL